MSTWSYNFDYDGIAFQYLYEICYLGTIKKEGNAKIYDFDPTPTTPQRTVCNAENLKPPCVM